MTLRLQSGQLEMIHRHAEADYPAECCGILLGRADAASKDIVDVAPIANLRRDPARAQDVIPLEDPNRESERNRFLIDPKEQLRVEKDARARGLTVVGYYHSHPDHPARPSGYDRDHAWPWYSYVIVSVEAGRARDTQSWVLDDDRAAFQPENLEVAGQATNDEWRQNRASQAPNIF
ncbi:MAG TPA: M67 family metallopeptidase [Terriglobia bacterium]|nr:M67 family metallopeptidase [Terriglobia bacterium]